MRCTAACVMYLHDVMAEFDELDWQLPQLSGKMDGNGRMERDIDIDLSKHDIPRCKTDSVWHCKGGHRRDTERDGM